MARVVPKEAERKPDVQQEERDPAKRKALPRQAHVLNMTMKKRNPDA